MAGRESTIPDTDSDRSSSPECAVDKILDAVDAESFADDTTLTRVFALTFERWKPVTFNTTLESVVPQSDIGDGNPSSSQSASPATSVASFLNCELFIDESTDNDNVRMRSSEILDGDRYGSDASLSTCNTCHKQADTIESISPEDLCEQVLESLDDLLSRLSTETLSDDSEVNSIESESDEEPQCRLSDAMQECVGSLHHGFLLDNNRTSSCEALIDYDPLLLQSFNSSYAPSCSSDDHLSVESSGCTNTGRSPDGSSSPAYSDDEVFSESLDDYISKYQIKLARTKNNLDDTEDSLPSSQRLRYGNTDWLFQNKWFVGKNTLGNESCNVKKRSRRIKPRLDKEADSSVECLDKTSFTPFFSNPDLESQCAQHLLQSSNQSYTAENSHPLFPVDLQCLPLSWQDTLSDQDLSDSNPPDSAGHSQDIYSQELDVYFQRECDSTDTDEGFSDRSLLFESLDSCAESFRKTSPETRQPQLGKPRMYEDGVNSRTRQVITVQFVWPNIEPPAAVNNNLPHTSRRPHILDLDVEVASKIQTASRYAEVNGNIDLKAVGRNRSVGKLTRAEGNVSGYVQVTADRGFHNSPSLRRAPTIGEQVERFEQLLQASLGADCGVRVACKAVKTKLIR